MKKILIIFTLVFCLFNLTACKNKVTSINIVENTVPQIIDIKDLDTELAKIQVELVMKKGDNSLINLSKDMISTEDYTKLTNLGTHTVVVTYQEEFTTSLTLTVEDSNAYVVKVVYPNGNPVTSGVSVQWCTNSTCMLPVYVNEHGIARNSIPEDNYFIHIDGIPAGYTYDPNAYTVTKTEKQTEIKLISLMNLTGEGSQDSPYVTSVGAFNVSYQEAINEWKYFSFTPTEAGTYSIKSLAVDKLATNAIDPYIGFLGTTNDMSNADYSGNIKDVINFNHSFVAEANVTYTFVVLVYSATRFPASFDIQISK